jgi:peptide/nickel transport system ATP-binding protein
MSANEKLLDIQHVTVEFHIGGLVGGTLLVAVNDISFSLDSDRPEIFTLAGESGSGKTTLSRLLLRDLVPTRGKVLFEGRDLALIRRRSEFKEFMKKVQPVFQNPFETFNPLRRVDAYLFDTALNFGMASNRAKAAGVVDEALHNVGLSLEEVIKRYPHELSGGQIQRVSVARALISKPKLILADEPVSMVDASLRMEIVNLFRKLRDEQKVSVIYITHDLATAYYISDRIGIMLRG